MSPPPGSKYPLPEEGVPSMSLPSQAIPSRTTSIDRIIGPPLITLVDIHGQPVPASEMGNRYVPMDPPDTSHWPDWTEHFRLGLGPHPALGGTVDAALELLEPDPDARGDLKRYLPEDFDAPDAPDANWYHPQSPGHADHLRPDRRASEPLTRFLAADYTPDTSRLGTAAPLHA
jgi:hypothetical protein